MSEGNFDHLVFNRPEKAATYYSPAFPPLHLDASGDTWGNYGASDDGNPPQPPYGHCCSLAPGHYELVQVDDNGDNCPSEGHYQIHVADLSDATKSELIASNHANADPILGTIDIGGIVLSRGGIAKWGRSEVMIHGGGTNLGIHALDDVQQLLRTWGCTRVHNRDLATLAHQVRDALAKGRKIIFSCIGDPALVGG